MAAQPQPGAEFDFDEDIFGRPARSLSRKHLIPFWVWALVVYLDLPDVLGQLRGLGFAWRLSAQEILLLRQTFFDDLVCLFNQLPWIMLILWDTLGIPPLVGTAPLSEKSPTSYFTNLPTFIGIFLFNIIPSIFAFIPGLCFLSHWFASSFGSRGGQLIREDPRRPQPVEEPWFFVNGICGTRNVGLLNVQRLNQLFNKDVTGIYNPSQGIFLDLIECITGRTFHSMTGPDREVLDQVVRALKSPAKKVVLIGHSQGSIIVSRVLAYLERSLAQPGTEHPRKVTREQVSKLEVYTFAAPTSTITTIGGAVHLEHFANYHDLVAQIGVLYQRPADAAGEIFDHQPGFRFVSTKRYGHLLNEHYLKDFETRPYTSWPRENEPRDSRLYDYLVTEQHLD